MEPVTRHVATAHADQRRRVRRSAAEGGIIHFAILFCLSVSASACRYTSAPLPTTPTTPSTSSPVTATVPVAAPTTVPPTTIAVGTEVTGTLDVHGAERVYELTAPSTGTLIAQLDWAPAQGRLQLDIADQIFAYYPENRSPLVGRLRVAAGVKYRIRVSDGAPWDYDQLSLPYVLTTVIE
jgi:hypothetical protein